MLSEVGRRDPTLWCILDVAVPTSRMKSGRSSAIFDGSLRGRVHCRCQSRPSLAAEASMTIALSIVGHTTTACFIKTCRYCITERALPSGVPVRAMISCQSGIKLCVLCFGSCALVYTRILPSLIPDSESTLSMPLHSYQHRFCQKGLKTERHTRRMNSHALRSCRRHPDLPPSELTFFWVHHSANHAQVETPVPKHERRRSSFQTLTLWQAPVTAMQAPSWVSSGSELRPRLAVFVESSRTINDWGKACVLPL